MNSWDARMQSPYENDLDSRMSWDLGAEVPASIDTKHRGMATTEWVSSSATEDFGSNYHVGFFTQHQDEDGRFKALQKTSKLEQGHKLWRQRDQILSPLILNPNIDAQKPMHSNSPFTLEDPIDADEQVSDHDWDYVMAQQREARPRAPLLQHETRRSHRKHTVGKADVLRSPPMAVASNMSKQLYSDYSRVVPSVSEFFEYEVQAMERPGKKESGKASQKSKPSKQGKGLASSKEERRGSSVGTRRRSSMNSGHQSEQVLSILNHPAARPVVAEPRPFLTELEDYNGSEEYTGASIAGELERLAMSELHGELELVACNNSAAPDRNNTGRADCENGRCRAPPTLSATRLQRACPL
ncbi:hypothetical protein GOP47_0024021 [Adiantum capillus-veneris]|uniref:Uncharacterized protein n=1 Tax=Adiantum capillus-veneris TaxID=13818 RepID=A0A9D4U749_ADICA|nr:hypothetical protein GOP47_0024021 [Adiantum capillus-veneris]